MADLGELLGALLTSLAHARRIADEETTAIAEYYRDNPLLEGMSLPRIRVPELRLDLPLVIQSHEGGEDHIPESAPVVRKALSTELRDQLKAEKIEVPPGFAQIFDKELQRQLGILRPTAVGRRSPREVVVRAVDNAFSSAVKQVGRGTLDQAASKRILAALRKRADEVALKRVGKPPSIDASILTSQVKEQADPANVTWLRIVMREEGLEWSVGEEENGAIRRTLTPE